MLKFGCRTLHFYPIMLLLFSFLRRSVEIVLRFHIYNDNMDFLIPFLIFFSQSLFGYLIHRFYSKKNISTTTERNRHNVLSPFKTMATVYMSNKSYLNKDSKLKKIILIIFASFFNFIGCLIRKTHEIPLGNEEDNNSILEERIRSIQNYLFVIVYE